MKHTTTLFLLIIGALLTSCKKDLTDLNKDPNNATEVAPDLLFKYAVKHGMSDYLTASHLEYNGLQQWMMYMATRGGIQEGQAYAAPTGADAFWQHSYADAMSNAQAIIRSNAPHHRPLGRCTVSSCFAGQSQSGVYPCLR